jgi:hypothetical protein
MGDERIGCAAKKAGLARNHVECCSLWLGAVRSGDPAEKGSVPNKGHYVQATLRWTISQAMTFGSQRDVAAQQGSQTREICTRHFNLPSLSCTAFTYPSPSAAYTLPLAMAGAGESLKLVVAFSMQFAIRDLQRV